MRTTLRGPQRPPISGSIYLLKMRIFFLFILFNHKYQQLIRFSLVYIDYCWHSIKKKFILYLVKINFYLKMAYF